MMPRLLGALALLTALAVAAGFAGHWLPLLDLVAAFRLHLAVLAGLLTLAALAARRWRAAGLAAAAALIAVLGLGPALEPAERAGEGRPLVVLFGNVGDRNSEAAALVDALVAHRADVLVTAETANAVAQRLARHYPYRLAPHTPYHQVRTAIWSRFPMRDGRIHLDDSTGPISASAVIDLGDGRALGLVGVHFGRPTLGFLPGQTYGLARIAGGLPQPLVIIGDFNATPWSATVALAARLTGAQAVGGYRVTWRGAYETPLGALPEPWGHQIDQILVSDGIGVEAVETVAMPGSDHMGLLARLRIPER